MGITDMSVRVITSMSQAGYDVYGKEFLDSYRKYVNFPLTIYSEDKLPVDEYKPIWDVEMSKLLSNYPRSADWRLDAGRFAWKAFAIIDALSAKDKDIVCWMDSDVVIHAPLKEPYVERMVGDHYCALMMRQDYHPCSSFVVYNKAHGDNVKFVAEMKRMYHGKDVLHEPEQHDAYIQGKVLLQNCSVINLTPGAKPMENVFDRLGFGHHKKGPLKWAEGAAS